MPVWRLPGSVAARMDATTLKRSRSCELSSERLLESELHCVKAVLAHEACDVHSAIPSDLCLRNRSRIRWSDVSRDSRPSGIRDEAQVLLAGLFGSGEVERNRGIHRSGAFRGQERSPCRVHSVDQDRSGTEPP